MRDIESRLNVVRPPREYVSKKSRRSQESTRSRAVLELAGQMAMFDADVLTPIVDNTERPVDEHDLAVLNGHHSILQATHDPSRDTADGLVRLSRRERSLENRYQRLKHELRRRGIQNIWHQPTVL
jgi:hypothetical protein